MEAPGSVEAVTPLRVVIVDDTADVRAVLRLQFRLDGRFQVVGEGSDGFEAIDLARELQPDLVILDRNMPRLGGLEAIEGLRAASPDTAVVLFTANADGTLYHDAVAAGALEVLDKAGGPEFVDRLTSMLLDRSDEADRGVEVRVGPVSGLAARTWIANSKAITAAVSAHPEVVAVAPDALDLFRRLLDEWQEAADGAEEFLWVARAALEDVTEIIEQWAAIDSMTDEQLAALGVHWSPPEGQPFFEALTAGILRALERHGESERLASRLVEMWAPWREGGVQA